MGVADPGIYLTAAGEVVDDLGHDGAVHVGEKQLWVAVGGHTAIHDHEGTLHCFPLPGVILLGDQEGEQRWGGCCMGHVCSHDHGRF